MRRKTVEVQVGNLPMGGDNPVRVQSMTTVSTMDTEGCIAQIKRIVDAGGEYVRLTTQGIREAENLKNIKEGLRRDGYDVPIIADVHFNANVADVAALYADKVRINPGNIGDKEKVKAVVDKCKQKHIPIRIGVNGGSLEKDLLEKYGKPTAEAMVESARRHIQILEDLGFKDYLVSLKASSLDLCIEAYRLASKEFSCPLHLGVTEAGTKFSGTIKSAIGLGVMLKEGIGDTVRVSLSDDPREEIPVAKEILKDCGLYNGTPTLVACPTCGRTQIDLIPIAKEVEEFLKTINSDITVAVMGCAVNGPGEAREADIGIAGGIKEGLLFKKGEIIRKVPQDKIVEVLKEEILKMTK